MAEFANEDTKEKEVVKADDASDSDDGAENAGEGNEGGRAGASRGEKKSRKAIIKLGMKPVAGIHRVTLKRSKTVLFAITNPEVFKAPTSETYIIFGEAKAEDLGAQSASAAAEQFRVPDKQAVKPAAPQAEAAPAAAAAEDVDESDIDPKDIELVIAQASCTRAAAVAALKRNDKDIVNAIMELTMT
jgi:nascent polypeptide-associated complex subunit alpha